MTEKNCGNCKFALRGPNHEEGDRVACRRFPPTLMYTAVTGRDLANQATLNWSTAAGMPLVTESTWCGEHADKPSAIFNS